MRHRAKALGCMLASLGVCAAANGIVAEDGGNPYNAIVTRNVFGLRPAPIAEPPQTKKADPPKITPTGITTITGSKRVLFKVQLPAAPPQPAKEQSYILREGDREGQIEVLEIDEKAGSIKFNNYGTEIVLTLEKDGAKVPNTPPAPVVTPPPGTPGAPPAGITYTPYAPPGAPPVPTTTITQPPPTISVIPGPTTTGMRSIPTRDVRSPQRPGFPPAPPTP